MAELTERERWIATRFYAAGQFDYDPLSGQAALTAQQIEAYMADAPPALTWSTEPPTEAGAYWWRHPDMYDVEPLVCNVRRWSMDRRLQHDHQWLPTNDLDGEWIPIPEPKEGGCPDDCPACSGEACRKCGAGMTNTGPCDHDVIDRHEQEGE